MLTEETGVMFALARAVTFRRRSSSEHSGKNIPMIGSGFKIDLMKHHIAVMIAYASCDAKIFVGSAKEGAVAGTDFACAALVLIAAEIPSDNAMAAAERGPGSVLSRADVPAFVAVFVAAFALFCADVSLAAAELAARRCSDGVVMVSINNQRFLRFCFCTLRHLF